MYEKKIIQR